MPIWYKSSIIPTDKTFLNWIKLEHAASLRLKAETPLPISPSVFVEDEYEVNGDFHHVIYPLLIEDIHKCSGKGGRSARSSTFTFLYGAGYSPWDDYTPILPFKMGRWSGPLLALAVSLTAEFKRTKCQSWLGRFMWTSLKTVSEQSVYWAVGQRMPNPLDFVAAHVLATTFVVFSNWAIGPSRWSLIYRRGLFGLIECGLFKALRRHHVVFFTHRLVMALMKPELFTARHDGWLRRCLATVSQGLYEWGRDEIHHLPISLFTTVLWPDFAQSVYEGLNFRFPKFALPSQLLFALGKSPFQSYKEQTVGNNFDNISAETDTDKE